MVFGLLLISVAASGCSKTEDTKETRLARANDYFAAGQYDKAEKEYREVLRLAPDDPTALRQLGIHLFRPGTNLPGLSAAQEIRGTTTGRSGNTT